MSARNALLAGCLLFAALAACAPSGGMPEALAQEALLAGTATPRPTATLTPTASATPTATPSATPSPSPTATATPYGCQPPPEDYSRVIVRGHMLNRRTEAMLAHAQALYGGSHDFMLALTQGSYNVGVAASFGTHDGGGAVDLAVRDLQDWHNILYDELDAMILALRQAGFAAWVRYEGDLYPDSPIHIHAIAIGDAELSPAAQEQLMGAPGYFRGYDGLPVDPPQPDRHGGPYLCPWMLEVGYRDLRVDAP